jgi:hypothetical protein
MMFEHDHFEHDALHFHPSTWAVRFRTSGDVAWSPCSRGRQRSSDGPPATSYRRRMPQHSSPAFVIPDTQAPLMNNLKCKPLHPRLCKEELLGKEKPGERRSLQSGRAGPGGSRPGCGVTRPTHLETGGGAGRRSATPCAPARLCRASRSSRSC